jgi:hypothetical protein
MQNKPTIKSWAHLPLATQMKLSEIYAKHHLGNLQAEGSHLKDAIAEIYQLGKGTPL